MIKLECIVRPERLDDVKYALNAVGVVGMTVSEVRGCGRQKGYVQHYRGLEYHVNLLPKVMIQTVVADDRIEEVLEAVQNAARTGEIGDGKIFLTRIDDVVRIRTGERGEIAL
ncbi:MAG TPA: P-II family nitrogen regulator [Armatimonadota bacterium]